MSILTRFRNLIFVFFVFGLAPFHTKTVYIKSKAPAYIPSVSIIAFFILNVSVYGLQFHFGHIQSFGLINSIISRAAILTGLVSNLSAIFQCYFYPGVYRNLIEQIKKIENNFRGNFSEKLPALTFAIQYRRKFLIIFALVTVRGVSTILMLWNSLNNDGVLIGVLQTATSIFSVLVLIHVILYIDIAQICLHALNLKVKNSPMCLQLPAKLEFLKYVKLMHMDLWKLVSQINHYFAWSLLHFTINFMINSVYDLYQIFRGLQPGSGIIWALGIVFHFKQT